MPKMNHFAMHGWKPDFDVYRIHIREFTHAAQDVLKKKFGFDFVLEITPDGTEDNHLNFDITNRNDIPESFREDMLEEGCDPQDSSDIANLIMFELSGGEDGSVELAADLSIAVSGDFEVDCYFYARQDVQLELLKALEVVMNGSRQDAILEINRLLKYVTR